MKDRLKRSSASAATLTSLAFAQFRSGLQQYLLRRLKSSASAEDLAQEVYLRLLRVGSDERVKHPQAYVYRVASNVLYEFRQHERRGLVAFDSEIAEQAEERWADEAAGPEESIDSQARERLLAGIVAGLPPMQRAVFLLAKHEDLSHAEIAKRLDIAVNTVRVHLYRALCECRQALSRTDEP